MTEHDSSNKSILWILLIIPATYLWSSMVSQPWVASIWGHSRGKARITKAAKDGHRTTNRSCPCSKKTTATCMTLAKSGLTRIEIAWIQGARIPRASVPPLVQVRSSMGSRLSYNSNKESSCKTSWKSIISIRVAGIWRKDPEATRRILRPTLKTNWIVMKRRRSKISNCCSIINSCLQIRLIRVKYKNTSSETDSINSQWNWLEQAQESLAWPRAPRSWRGTRHRRKTIMCSTQIMW